MISSPTVRTSGSVWARQGKVGHAAEVLVQSQVLQDVGAGAAEVAVGVGLLPEAGGEGGREHGAQFLDWGHAQ